MAGVVVSDVYKVYQGENLTFTADGYGYGFYLQEVDPNRSPNLTIAGQVNVEQTSVGGSSAPSVLGVLAGNGFQATGGFTIEATGVLRVTSTVGQATGFGDMDWSPDVINRGRVEVVALGTARGFSADDGLTANYGTLKVTSTQDAAVGVTFSMGGTFYNSGLIDVSAGGAWGARGVSFGGHKQSFLNDVGGVIHATSTSPSSPEAIGVEWHLGAYTERWVNKGLIDADIALTTTLDGVQNRQYDFVNDGQIIGRVELHYSADVFDNDGRIQGDVSLGEMDDIYYANFTGGSGVVLGLVSGGDGNDSLDGGRAADALAGDAGDDLLNGHGGADSLDGGRGDDVIQAGESLQSLGASFDGGLGTDTLSYINGASAVTVDLSTGVATGATIRNIEHVIGTFAADRLLGSAAGDVLEGGHGGDDTILGGAGNDTIQVNAGQTFLRGEEGDDLMRGGSGFDNMQGNTGADTVGGGDGDDWVLGGKDNDQASGDAGNDVLNGNLGEDTCQGGSGDDVVRGGQGNDILDGGAGADLLFGDHGSDTMTGGPGADTFFIGARGGADRVTDFNYAEGDRIRVEGGATFHVVQSGADLIVDLGNGDQMILTGVSQSSLPAGWLV
jgi:serralysin